MHPVETSSSRLVSYISCFPVVQHGFASEATWLPLVTVISTMFLSLKLIMHPSISRVDTPHGNYLFISTALVHPSSVQCITTLLSVSLVFYVLVSSYCLSHFHISQERSYLRAQCPTLLSFRHSSFLFSRNYFYSLFIFPLFLSITFPGLKGS